MIHVTATIAKIHVWKYTIWFVPSIVSFIAIPIAFTLMTCNIEKKITNEKTMNCYFKSVVSKLYQKIDGIVIS